MLLFQEKPTKNSEITFNMAFTMEMLIKNLHSIISIKLNWIFLIVLYDVSCVINVLTR